MPTSGRASSWCFGTGAPTGCELRRRPFSPHQMFVHTIGWRERADGKWPKACVWASKEARRRGANPSPRSWPRICSCKCSGWHFEEMPDEVRAVAERFRKGLGGHEDYLQWAPTGLRLSFCRAATSRTSRICQQMLDDLASRGHPLQLHGYGLHTSRLSNDGAAFPSPLVGPSISFGNAGGGLAKRGRMRGAAAPEIVRTLE